MRSHKICTANYAHFAYPLPLKHIVWRPAYVYALVALNLPQRRSNDATPGLLKEHLAHAASVRLIALANATHFVHLDRPERGRDQFIREVLTFLSSSQ